MAFRLGDNPNLMLGLNKLLMLAVRNSAKSLLTHSTQCWLSPRLIYAASMLAASRALSRRRLNYLDEHVRHLTFWASFECIVITHVVTLRLPGRVCRRPVSFANALALRAENRGLSL